MLLGIVRLVFDCNLNIQPISSVPKGTLTTYDDYPNHKTKMTQDATQWTTDEIESYEIYKLPVLILIVLVIIMFAAWFYFCQLRLSELPVVYYFVI